MVVGSLPITAMLRMRARGTRPARRPASAEPISIKAAPSTMPDELPAWCRCVICSTVVHLRSAVAPKPIAPIIAKLGSSRASDASGQLVRSRGRCIHVGASPAFQRGDQIGAKARGLKPSAVFTRGSITQAPPSLPIGQRLMPSTPPATT